MPLSGQRVTTSSSSRKVFLVLALEDLCPEAPSVLKTNKQTNKQTAQSVTFGYPGLGTPSFPVTPTHLQVRSTWQPLGSDWSLQSLCSPCLRQISPTYWPLFFLGIPTDRRASLYGFLLRPRLVCRPHPQRTPPRRWHLLPAPVRLPSL